MKTTFKSIPEQRKVRELPRTMHTAEVEEAKKCENYHAKPVSDPFNQDHRRTPKSARITTKNEHQGLLVSNPLFLVSNPLFLVSNPLFL